MVEIKLDTEKIRSCGNMLIELSNELNEAINCFFNRICDMPTITGEWISDSAVEYSRIAKLDKVQYITLKNELMNEGKFLVSQAEIIEQEIASLKR